MTPAQYRRVLTSLVGFATGTISSACICWDQPVAAFVVVLGAGVSILFVETRWPG